MCGIVGYTGKRQAAPVLLNGLEKLEYRGYDSAGVAVMQPTGKIRVEKAKGKLCVLSEKIRGGKELDGTCGIGHTRWATHGEPSENNAHPHINAEGSVAAVHNGIIENFSELKQKLMRRGYVFYSDTDTEVATKLVDYYYKKFSDPLRALSQFTLRVRGSYALAVMFEKYPDIVFAVRKDSPMVVGAGDREAYLASDVPAILGYTRNVYFPENFQIVRLSPDGADFFNLDCEKIGLEKVYVDWDAEAAEKDGFEHFMLKEIHSQPRVIKETLSYAAGFSDGREGIPCGLLGDIRRLIIVGCGSAYHVGVCARYVIERLARIPVTVEIASEFRYRNPVFTGGELAVVISQSGETADSLAALRTAKESGVKTFAIVNVLGSSIAREADFVLYTKAGPEISVATTKAYSAQLIAVYVLAVRLAEAHGRIEKSDSERLFSELEKLPQKVESLLSRKQVIQALASEYMAKKDVFFIGRGIDYAVCIEGGLKLKEVSYMHSEAYAAGELKHGTISLVEEGTLVVGVITQSALAEKTVANLQEVKSRGAEILVIASRNIEGIPPDFKVLEIPETDSLFSASLAVVPLQLFAYYLSVLRGNDVDKPRNLAKSVTVE